MSLIKKLLSEMDENARQQVIDSDGSTTLENVVKAWEKYSDSIVDAEVVTDEDNTLYDYRVFDPQHVSGSLYTNFDGWTHWLCQYEDNEHNTIDIIFDEYDGVPQGI